MNKVWGKGYALRDGLYHFKFQFTLQTKQTFSSSLEELQSITSAYLHECFALSESGLLYWKERPAYHFSETRVQKSFNSKWAGKRVGKTGRVGFRGSPTVRLTTCDKSLLLKTAHIVWVMHDREVVPGWYFINIDGNPLNNRIDNLLHVDRSRMLEEVVKQREEGKRKLKVSYQDKVYENYWTRVVRGAEVREIDLTIDMDDAFEVLVSQCWRCALSGIKIGFAKSPKEYTANCNSNTASIDRIDSSKGYVKGNIQWVHKQVNALKMDLPDAEFVNWCKLIADHCRDK